MADPVVRGNRTRAAGAVPADRGGIEPSGHARWVRDAVTRFERQLTQYAAHITGDPERARDVVQEAFLRLCDQDAALIGSHLAEWLYTVCRNLAIDVKRKEKRMRLMTDEQAEAFVSDDIAPTEPAEVEDSLSHVMRAMRALPTNQQECIRLKFQHGMSYKQISQVTNLSVTNVGFLIHTGLKALRKQLSDGTVVET
jgi:RNA polymerase sigma-70 factor (ECF subfamily)